MHERQILSCGRNGETYLRYLTDHQGADFSTNTFTLYFYIFAGMKEVVYSYMADNMDLVDSIDILNLQMTFGYL